MTSKQSFHVIAGWTEPHCATFAESVVFVQQLLELLKGIHSEFTFWASLGQTQYEPMAADLSDLEQHLSVMARPAEDDRCDYTHLDPAGAVTALTTTTRWFMYNFYTSESGYSGGMESARPDIARLKVTLQASGGSSLALTLPHGRADLVNGDVVTRIVTAIIGLCNPNSLRVYSSAFDEACRQGRPLTHVLDASWMLFVRAPLLAKCVPDTVPCTLERWPDGRLMFRLTDEPPQSDRPADVDAARKLQNFFDRYHYDHPYTMRGWPLEQVDEQYRRQIIGPTDHAYVVAFVAFDGYDSVRDVLLYTKMFRNFTGRIANPYDLTRPELLEALPHVVQARQHLAALDYLGASTPVEWHIGIEQNAKDLRLLLNDAAKIPERRLRVVYTRFVDEAG